MKNTQLKGFSFIEILMIITILALISVVAYTSFGVRQNNAVNSKIQSEVTSLWNALLIAKQENNILPQPQWNKNFFAEDTSYVHDFEDSETFWVHGFITHNTLAKKYIDIVPVDPRTGSFYAYWKSKWTWSLDEMYEIAWVVWDWDTPSTFVSWDYTAENGPFNLIREYNGPNFVHNESTLHFPYNPLERILTAKIDSYTWSVSINWIETYTQNELLSYELKSWDTVEVKQNGVVELYYSDGSRSILWDSSNDTILTLQKMDFIQDNNIITDIKLVLESGMIWNKAASLDDKSGFEIYTTDSTAAVRWTIFWIQKNENNSEVIVQKWTVAIKQNLISSAETLKSYISNEDTNSIPTIAVPMIPGLIDIENTETVIKVENNDPEKWASVWSTWWTSFSTWSIDDIPTIIKDQTINNSPTINPNIKISLKEYYYSSDTDQISITLDIPKRVYKTADYLIINDSDVLLKENWWTSYTQSWRTISHTFDSLISPIHSANFTESDIVSQSIKSMTNIQWMTNHDEWLGIDDNEWDIDGSEWGIDGSEWGIDGSEWGIDASEYNNRGELQTWEQTYLNQLLFSWVSASVWSENLVSYVNSKIYSWERDFTLQLAKRTLNGKIRVTNKIKFTIVDDKTYYNEEKEDNIIDEEEIKEESEEKLAQERWIENKCNWFFFDNISGEKDLCATADTNLKSDLWNLVAYAPYNHAGDIILYSSWSNNEPKTNKVVTYKNWINWDSWKYQHNIWVGWSAYGNGVANLPIYCIDATENINYSNSLCKVWWKNWIYIDNTSNKWDTGETGWWSAPASSFSWNDFIKYLNVDLSWDFLIEINIKWSALKELNTKWYIINHTLISINWENFSLMRSSNNGPIFLLKWSTSICWYFGINCTEFNWLDSNEFYSIYIQNNSTQLEWTWINKSYANISGNASSWFYLWSTNNKVWQWDSIINYLKIYKK